MPDNKLDKELQTYEENKSRLVAESEGKYVLVCGEDIKGVWDTYEDALKSGYKECGLGAFLVKKISGVEKVQFFTRDVPACPS